MLGYENAGLQISLGSFSDICTISRAGKLFPKSGTQHQGQANQQHLRNPRRNYKIKGRSWCRPLCTDFDKSNHRDEDRHSSESSARKEESDTANNFEDCRVAILRHGKAIVPIRRLAFGPLGKQFPETGERQEGAERGADDFDRTVDDFGPKGQEVCSEGHS